MLHIKRENGVVKYAYEPCATQFKKEYHSYSPTPHQIPYNSEKWVRMDKWYVVHKHVVDTIVDTYIERFQDFVASHPRYSVKMDLDGVTYQLIRKLYIASQSKKRNFV